jgi:formylmethanofuran dehydrogenase subunit C
VKPLVLTLRQPPDQRLDLSPLVPHRLAGKSAPEIAAIPLQTGRMAATVGDIFRLRMGEVESIRIDGGSDRLDGIGEGMTSGEIAVDGDAGARAGRLMAGGRLTITGHAGPYAASGMKGGELVISRSAGERLGGPLAGETAGMRGGVVTVLGDAGDRAGDRLRRGTIVIEGRAGREIGSRMIAGTLIVRRAAGPYPGFLMGRGTIVLGESPTDISPGFVDCGQHELVALRLMAAFVRNHSRRAAALLERPLQRFAGDMAVLGRGEILIAGAG